MMAIYRLSMKVGKPSSGRAHFDYIYGEGKYKRIGTDDDIRLSNSVNMPSWAKSPRDFWKEEEKKGDGYRKIELALPIELCKNSQNLIVEEFMSSNFNHYACSYAIHDSKDGKNPHVHIMFSERKIEVEREEPDRESYFKRGGKRKDGTRTGGYAKDRTITGSNRKEWLKHIREYWANLQNKYLKLDGYDVRVSDKSLKEQGIDRVPQIHVGSAGYRMKNQSDRYELNQEIIATNIEYDRLLCEHHNENEVIRSLESSIESFVSEKTRLVELIAIEDKLEEQRKLEENHRLELAQKQAQMNRERDLWLDGIQQYPKANREPTGAYSRFLYNGEPVFSVYENGVIVDARDNRYNITDIASRTNHNTFTINHLSWTVKSDIPITAWETDVNRVLLNEQRKLEEQRILEEQRRLELAQKQSNFEPQGVFGDEVIEKYEKTKKEPVEANKEILKVNPEWPIPSNRKPKGSRLSFTTSGLSTYSDGLIKYKDCVYEMSGFKVVEEKAGVMGKRLLLSTPSGKVEVPEKAYKQSKELGLNMGMSR